METCFSLFHHSIAISLLRSHAEKSFAGAEKRRLEPSRHSIPGGAGNEALSGYVAPPRNPLPRRLCLLHPNPREAAALNLTPSGKAAKEKSFAGAEKRRLEPSRHSIPGGAGNETLSGYVAPPRNPLPHRLCLLPPKPAPTGADLTASSSQKTLRICGSA